MAEVSMGDLDGRFGFAQWFAFEDFGLVEASIRVMRHLGCTQLRTCFSWADWERPGGPAWLDWLVSRLSSAGIRLFPSLFYTPMRCAMLPPGVCREDALTAFPPEDPREYVAYVDEVITRYGYAFDWALLWNEPNNTAYWRSDLDPGGQIFREMTDGAMCELHRAGKQVLIGSLVPPYAPWLRDMREAGILEQADAVGIHDFPGTWNDKKRVWRGWDAAIHDVRALIYPTQNVWITETGYSTRTLDDPENREVQERREIGQVQYFEEVRGVSGVERVFWYSIFDQMPGHVTDNEANRPDRPPHDPRADGLGILTFDGRPKRLYLALEGGQMCAS